MQQVFVAGDEPVPGYKLIEEIEGSAFYKVWHVSTPDGTAKWWKIIDLVVGNAAIETRTLGLLIHLKHPHLNTLTNFWNLDDGKTLIIESEVPSCSLRDRLQQCQNEGKRGITLDEAIPIFEQAAEGLDFLNSPRHDYQGQQVAIYHRSLRPECLLLFEEEQGYVCRVSDFGLSKPVTEEAAQHSQGLLHYDYDPPEFFEGQTAPTSDQYSLAVNYYEMRTGCLPFQGTMLEQLQARLNDSPDLSLIDEPERSVLARALHREPSSRFESCQSFVEHLKGNGGSPAINPMDSGAMLRSLSAQSSQEDQNASSYGMPTPGGLTSTLVRGEQNGHAAAPPVAEPAPAMPTPGSWPASPAASAATAAPEIPGVVYHRSPDPSSDTSPMEHPEPVPERHPSSVNGLSSSPSAYAALEGSPMQAEAEHLAVRTSTERSAAVSSDVRSIRDRLSINIDYDDASVGDEKKVPIIWVAVILGVTALATIWVTSLLP